MLWSLAFGNASCALKNYADEKNISRLGIYLQYLQITDTLITPLTEFDLYICIYQNYLQL
jgi:hypothetical protein